MRFASVVLGLAGVAVGAGLVVAGEGCGSCEAKKMTPEQEAMMAKCMEAGKPGAGHQVLAGMVGTWNHTIKGWMEPGGEPCVSAGTSEIRWILGGRFIEQRVTGKCPMGQPFEGLGIVGFDNVTQEYQGIWTDSMSTAMMTGTGTYDAATKTITDRGTFSCPMMGKKCAYRSTTRFVDKDHFTFEFFCAGPDGKEFRMMEIQYVRSAAKPSR